MGCRQSVVFTIFDLRCRRRFTIKPFVGSGMLALADRLIDRAKNQADSGAHSKEDGNKEQHGGAGEAVSNCHHRI